MTPILSIIIVAYRSREEIGDCLGSLPRELLGRPVEVGVVDNYPADGIGALIREKFPWVAYLDPGANVGFGAANNLGYRQSSGECVLFLNPDTVINAAALEHCVRRVLAEPELGLLSPRLELADGTMDLACRRSIPTLWDGFCRAAGLAAIFPHTALFAGYNLTHLPADGTYSVGAINGAFMLGRRAVFDAVARRGTDGALPVFDEAFFMYGDDLDLCIRVAQAGWKIVYDGSQRITHLKGTSVAKDFDRMSRAIFDANRDVYLKHFGGSWPARIKWRMLFGLWKRVALFRARLRGHARVRPV